MKKVALATCKDLPHLDGDEAPLVESLRRRHVPFEIIPWDAGDDAFFACDMTVIRSTWDYTARVDEFVTWARRIEERSRIFNKASVVRWNTHKRYLKELEDEKIAVVPTLHIAATSHIQLGTTLRERGWTRGAVVKPAVSAGSKDTARVIGMETAEAQALLERELPTRDMMVQPFVEGIKAGELSLIYIDGTLSHAVNKKPKSNDFRSQPEFGSDVKRVEVTKEVRRAADDILAIVGGGLLYARVDFVTGDDGKPWLMELELVEPGLYLAWDDTAADRLVDAIAARL